jgi:hypothetical protein
MGGRGRGVILPFSKKGRPVTNYREMSKTAKGGAQNSIAVVDRTGKLRSPLNFPHQDEDKLKRTGNKFYIHISETKIKYIYIYVHIYIISRLDVYVPTLRRTQVVTNKKASVLSFIKLLTLATFHDEMFRTLLRSDSSFTWRPLPFIRQANRRSLN